MAAASFIRGMHYFPLGGLGKGCFRNGKTENAIAFNHRWVNLKERGAFAVGVATRIALCILSYIPFLSTVSGSIRLGIAYGLTYSNDLPEDGSNVLEDEKMRGFTELIPILGNLACIAFDMNNLSDLFFRTIYWENINPLVDNPLDPYRPS